MSADRLAFIEGRITALEKTAADQASAARGATAPLEKRVAALEKRLADVPVSAAPSKHSRVIVWGSVALVLFLIYFLMHLKLF